MEETAAGGLCRDRVMSIGARSESKGNVASTDASQLSRVANTKHVETCPICLLNWNEKKTKQSSRFCFSKVRLC